MPAPDDPGDDELGPSVAKPEEAADDEAKLRCFLLTLTSTESDAVVRRMRAALTAREREVLDAVQREREAKAKDAPSGCRFGALVAYLMPQGGPSPILRADGALKIEVESHGWFLEDHDMPEPSERGLMVFEGLVESSVGPEPESILRGRWRPITHAELCRLAEGRCPWPTHAAGGSVE